WTCKGPRLPPTKRKRANRWAAHGVDSSFSRSSYSHREASIDGNSFAGDIFVFDEFQDDARDLIGAAFAVQRASFLQIQFALLVGHARVKGGTNHAGSDTIDADISSANSRASARVNCGSAPLTTW